MLTARFCNFQSFKQRRKGNTGFNFSCCLSASQTLHPVTQDMLTCFGNYALTFYLLPNFCSKQTKNQALVQKHFLFPCPLTPQYELPISKLILESCNKGCSSGQFHLHKKKQQLLCLRFALVFRAHLDFQFFGLVFLRGTATKYATLRQTLVGYFSGSFLRHVGSPSTPGDTVPQWGALVPELQSEYARIEMVILWQVSVTVSCQGILGKESNIVPLRDPRQGFI